LRGIRPLSAFVEVSLGRQRSPQHENGPCMVPYLRAANVKDGKLDLSDVKWTNFTPDEQRVFHLLPGDVLVTEGSGSLKAVGASAVWSAEIDGVVCFQNTLLRLRPRVRETDPKFVAWWARHAFASGLFASVADGANIFHISAERVRSLPVLFPEASSQRPIAMFLESKTQSLGELINRKRQMIELLKERATATIDSWIWPQPREGWRDGRLKHMLSQPPRYGVLKPEDYAGEDGVPLVRIFNIDGPSIDKDELIRISPRQDTEYRRTKLRAGDVVVSVVGTLGKGFIAGPTHEGLNLSRALARLVLKPGIDPNYILLWVSSTPFRQRCESICRATAQSVLNMGDLAEFPIRLPVPVEKTSAVASAVNRELRPMLVGIAALNRQIALLNEHRQALITEAVTGQLDFLERQHET